MILSDTAILKLHLYCSNGRLVFLSGPTMFEFVYLNLCICDTLYYLITVTVIMDRKSSTGRTRFKLEVALQ